MPPTMNRDEERAIEGRLAAIEAKLDFLVQAEKDKEQRLRALERRDAYVLGGATLLSFLSPLILKKVFGL